MNKADIGNAIFELGGALLQLMNVRKLLQDRRVQGVYWPVTAFFAAWGVWNLYFYWALGAPLSVLASAVITVTNITWVVLAIRYSRIKYPELKTFNLKDVRVTVGDIECVAYEPINVGDMVAIVKTYADDLPHVQVAANVPDYSKISVPKCQCGRRRMRHSDGICGNCGYPW